MAAPIGNKFALGLEESGRPPIFKNEKQLLNKIKQYFDAHSPHEEKDEETGEFYTVNPASITITGLALYLGFESRQSFYDYEAKEEYSYIIKRARLAIESCYEEGLQVKFPTGSIFALKNMGWKDKQEITQTLTMTDDPFKQIRDNAGLNTTDEKADSRN